MDRRFFSRAAFGCVGPLLVSSAKAADTKAHRIVIQIDTEDRRSQQVALGNVRNLAASYKGKSEPYTVEIVVFGPGFSMVRGDISMMKGEIETLQKDLGASLKIVACHKTREAIADSEGKKPDGIPLLPGVTETPSGIVHIVELQEQGWSYVRP